MGDAVLKQFIYNEKLFDISEFEKIYKDKYPSVYEVIRVIDGIPLFLEEHYQRFVNSFAILGYELKQSYDDIKNLLYYLIKANGVINNNVKIVINNLDCSNDSYFFFIKSKYPDENMYRNGVKTFLYKAERKNPNAKVIDNDLRGTINKLIAEGNFYEAILVSNKGEITEGSRSNLFFIKDDYVVTAPNKDVLKGITRQRIISLCEKENIRVLEEPIPSDNIKCFQAAFICGTSPKVLPISKIDELSFSLDNSVLSKIMNAYDREIQNYIALHK